jgi:hypothetical protein
MDSGIRAAVEVSSGKELRGLAEEEGATGKYVSVGECEEVGNSWQAWSE